MWDVSPTKTPETCTVDGERKSLALMIDAKYLRDLAEECRRLMKLSHDFEMIAELNEIAEQLIAKADAMQAAFGDRPKLEGFNRPRRKSID
jgi:hypothetical protein